MRWPDALGIVEAIWTRAPNHYKYNHQFKRYEVTLDNSDCSSEGFEGVRAQDILPLLLERFSFEKFLGFGNLRDLFIDRSFDHNLDREKPEDRDFIDRVHAVNDLLIDIGYLKPTPGEHGISLTECSLAR